MKKNIANFETFIIEQKAWFEENLAADFAESWDSFVWICGIKGSGWLRGNGANLLRFDEVNRLKGIDDRHTVSEPYQLFMKAMLGNDSNLLIVFYVQIMPDDFVMQLHRF
ncbi:Permease, cytosine/purine, uracil, thiamine, allantoin family [Escherichia coli]|nr:Permease, cytosine/purine, uracil, thiamine, allantoin family [Escherichia coli]